MARSEKGYKRIILNIPEEMYKKAAHTLRIKGNDLKDYLMDFIKKSVTIEKKAGYDKDSIWGIVGLGKSKTGDLATKHDAYLYGSRGR
jgi:hypothetical protein